MALSYIVRKIFQTHWRVSRGLTMGAQGVIISKDDRVLLVRHTYHPGWHFPGGGVERNETVGSALRREIWEEAGVVLKGEPELHGVFANFKIFPSDHVALFIVREWEQTQEPKLGMEIAEWGMFPLRHLPEEASGAVERRVAEIFDGAEINENW